MTATTSAPVVLVDATLDQSVRCGPGERFHQVFEQHIRGMIAQGRGDWLAVDLPGEQISFAELDRRANRVARYLAARGVRPGHRVGLLFDRSAHPYVAILAVSKLHAAYVPLDAAFPPDRLAYICADAQVSVVLTRPRFAALFDGTGVPVEVLDGAYEGFRDDALSEAETGAPAEELAYIIYTSGSTGRPKGVAIEHAAICNFIKVAAEHYGFSGADRVYQGMTIAFDFSVEEIWVPLLAGATLVPAPGQGALLGADLAVFLREQKITALVCVPTLLATLEEELPQLNLLLVSGEACPQDLVSRWARPGRRFLNVYGPTEATVTATWTTLEPGRPVTIGVPLPTYQIVILAPEPDSGSGDPQPVPFGEVGEIAIAGVGLSPGYVGRDDLTARAFVPDPLGLPGNPSGRLYRTGDLGRVTPEGEVEYLGRIDTQVKIRGYRIEVSEIESVLMELGAAQAAVITHEPQPGLLELAAFVTAPGPIEPGPMLARLKQRVPPYMVPAYLEQLPQLPMLPSDKVDRSALPAPSAQRQVVLAGAHDTPESPAETVLANAAAQVLGLPEVSVTADLFAELGADSLRIARLCSLVRAEGTLAQISTRDVYLNPTLRTLAAHLLSNAPDDAARGRVDALPQPSSREPHVATRAAYLGCAAVQFGVYAGYLLLLGVLGTWGYSLLDGATLVTGYLRAVAFAAVSFSVLSLLPIAVKWVLVGRWTDAPIPIWSLRYLRFWTVRTALALSPLRLFTGSPIYSLYLRALGVRIGRDVLVLTTQVPVCSDLATIGDSAVIREDALIRAYRAEAGWIVPGRIEIGAGAVVGEGALVDIGTTIEPGGQLAHASGLLAGQTIPAGRYFHGSPAVDARAAQAMPVTPVSARRRVLYSVGQVCTSILITQQMLVLGALLAIDLDVTHLGRAALAGLVLLGLMLIGTMVLPRLAMIGLRPGVDLPAYGLRWAQFRFIARRSNSPFFNTLLGDSSLITGYLAAIGFRFRNHQQTGSNFGTTQRHHVPFLTTVGGGSLVSDGLAVLNAGFTAHSFRLHQIDIGARVFMGNRVYYPPGAALGDDVLLATKVMVPDDGPRRAGVGLLGSPAFEIPRTVARDTQFGHLTTPDVLPRMLSLKLRHNAVSMVLYLTQRWLLLFLTVLWIAELESLGAAGLAAALLLGVISSVLVVVTADRAARGFRALQPQYCSLYDRTFWRHERYWKLGMPEVISLFDGTPFKGLAWRLFGMPVGRQLFDDGCTITERTLVTIGDHVTLGTATCLSGHSLEDGAFKSDRIELGSGTTVSSATWVHYGVTTGAGVVLAPDSFVMKGETPADHSVWQGNPAVPVG
jgi:non-ribosomal peptide synthetase-like protein